MKNNSSSSSKGNVNVCKKLTIIGHLPFARTGSAELCAVSGKTDPAQEQITQYGYKELSL